MLTSRILRSVSLAVLSTLTLWRSEGQPNGVTFVGHADFPHGSSSSGFKYSSCWGWVSPDGREYALIGAYNGVSIIDLNGDSLRELQFIPGPPSIWHEMKTWGNYAYCVSEGGMGVQIVDLSGLPDTAVLVKNFIYISSTPPDSGKSNARSHTVTVADGYLYCNGSLTWGPAGTVIFSLLADPTTPAFAGTYEPLYIHDSYVRNDTLFGAAIYNGGGLFIADVHDKANPVQITKITYAGSGTHNAWRSMDGRYVFTTDEIGTTHHNMKVWDISNLPLWDSVTVYSASPVDIVHNVHVRGNYIYVAHYTAGMRVVDAHDPRNPIEVGYYDTYPGPSGGYAGVWGVYPYFPSGKWIASDIETGLYVCRFDSLKPRVRPRLLFPPDSAVSTATKQFRWTLAANQTEDPHFYRLHIKGPTVDTVFRTIDTVFQAPDVDPFGNGGSFRWYVTVCDEFTEVSSQDTFHFSRLPASVATERSVPKSFSLGQNYPNPFNPMTKIEFTLAEGTDVTLIVYDLLGKPVRVLLNGERLPRGKQEVVFDASNLATGTYFYRLVTPRYTQTKKLILSR